MVLVLLKSGTEKAPLVSNSGEDSEYTFDWADYPFVFEYETEEPEAPKKNKETETEEEEATTKASDGGGDDIGNLENPENVEDEPVSSASFGK